MNTSLYTPTGSTAVVLDEPVPRGEPPKRRRRPKLRIPPKAWDYAALIFILGAAAAFNWQRVVRFVHDLF